MSDSEFPLEPLAPACLPWQLTAMEQLQVAAESQRLPHGLLLHGLPGSGLKTFAGALARLLSCSAPTGVVPCGSCRSCTLNEAGHHPDLRRLEPEKRGAVISVNQVRDAIEFGQQTAQMGGRRLLLIAPAENMNVYAANSLLKLLEEPGDNMVLILLTYATNGLLPTIRSRCQSIQVPTPGDAEAIKWLEAMTGDRHRAEQALAIKPNRPVAALNLYQDGGLELYATLGKLLAAAETGSVTSQQLAATWEQVGAEAALEWLYQHYLGQAREAVLAGAGSANARLALVDMVRDSRRTALAGNNPNLGLLLQSLAQQLVQSSRELLPRDTA